MKLKSFAKINLGLEVLRKREDGYHDIRTLFQSISLYDEIEAEKLKDRRIIIAGTGEKIPCDERNLMHRAASVLQRRFSVNKGILFKIKKNIPIGKGLGGGSSNAAVALLLLNKLWEIKTDFVTLDAVAKQIGADVPYFLRGGFCLGTNRGDKIYPLKDLPCFYCLLIFPEFPISTAYIYSNHRVDSLTSGDKESKIIKFLEKQIFSILENDLEETIFRPYPQLADLKQILLKEGAEVSLVSGTGSTIFGIFSSRQQAERARSKLGRTWTAMIVETVGRNRYREESLAGV